MKDKLVNRKKKYLDIGITFFVLFIMLIITNILLHSYVKLYRDKQYVDMVACSDNLNSQIYEVMMKPFSRIISLTEITKSVKNPENIRAEQLDSMIQNTNYNKIIFAQNNIISSVYPKDNKEAYIGKDFSSAFNIELNLENLSKSSGPVIAGPVFDPVTNAKLIAAFMPVIKDSYWGYVAILLDNANIFDSINLDITDERKILCNIAIKDKYSEKTTTVLETKTPLPKKLPSSSLTCTKTYFTTPFVTTLTPIKTVSHDTTFVLFTLLLFFLCIIVTFITYTIVHGYTLKQDYEFYKIQSKLVTVQEHTIISLSSLVENRDSDTGSHIRRTSDYVQMIAQEAKNAGLFTETITDDYIQLIKNAAPMHDIGKIVVPDSVLKKPGKLTEEEFTQIKKHSSEGGRIIEDILGPVHSQDFVQISKEIALYHHEKWNGKGYPFGKKETEIPLCARIMAIADVFDALTTPRCYKEPFCFEDAIEIIRKDSGTHFDPQLTMIFLNNQDKLHQIMNRHKS